MSGLKITIGGKTLTPDTIHDIADKMAYDIAVNHVKTMVGSMKCPIHGREATIVVTGKSSSAINFDASCCCPEFLQTVKERLGRK